MCILLPSRQDEPIWLLGIARFFQQYNKSFNSPACSVNMVGGVHSFRYKVFLCIMKSIRALVVKSFCCITKLKTTPTFAGVHTDMMPRNDFAANRLHFAAKRPVSWWGINIGLVCFGVWTEKKNATINLVKMSHVDLTPVHQHIYTHIVCNALKIA